MHDRKVTSSRSEPPTPRHHVFVNSPSQGKGILLPPAEYKPSSQRSSMEEPRKSLHFHVPLDNSRPSTPTKMVYQSIDWGLLGIGRRGPRQKYIITLLYWPSLTLYTWPLDPKSPFDQGVCYITATQGSNASSSSDVVKMSLTVLEDAVRAWMQQGKPHRVHPSGYLEVEHADIVRVCERLNLTCATEEQRSEWLQRQQVPDIPSSLPSSKASTPAASPGI